MLDRASIAARIGRPDLAVPSGPVAAQPDPVLEGSLATLVVPRRLPWGADPFYAEGQVILRGGAAAAAAVLTAATAAANASGFTLADGYADQSIATFQVPPRKVAVVTAYYARPLDRLGYESGHATFALSLGGRKPIAVPSRLLGLRGKRDNPIECAYAVGPTKAIAVLGTNGSDETWHAVEAYVEGWMIDEAVFRKLVTNNV